MLGTGSFVAWWIDGIEGNQGSGQFQGVGDISRRQLIHLYEGMPAGHAAKKPIMADPKKPKKSCNSAGIREAVAQIRAWVGFCSNGEKIERIALARLIWPNIQR